MTNRISIRPPGVFAFNTSQAESAKDPVAAPGQFPDWLVKLSQTKLELTVGEWIDSAIIGVLKNFEGAFFRKWENEKRQDLAVHILDRLREEPIDVSEGPTTLGDILYKILRERGFLDDQLSPKFDKHFCDVLREFVPEIAEDMADEHCAKLETQILQIVNCELSEIHHKKSANGETEPLQITLDSDQNENYREFIRRGIDEVAGIMLSRQLSNVDLKEILTGLAKALYVIDDIVTKKELSTQERNQILRRLMDEKLPANEPLVLQNEYYKWSTLNQAINDQIRNHIDPAEFGQVHHMTEEIGQ